MCKELILCWQNPQSRSWLPVGWLSMEGGSYIFEYTKAASQAVDNKKFVPLSGMKYLDKKYTSESLFPVFKNRLLAKSRPEYIDFINWLGAKGKKLSDMEELMLSGGIRATDNLQLYPVPKELNGLYKIRFFAHGIRHFSDCSQKRAMNLESGDPLFIMKDIQNKFDSTGEALLLRTDDPPENLGYCPRFLSKDFDYLLHNNERGKTKVTITQVNSNSPLHFRLLCEFTSSWPKGFKPFSSESFQRLSDSVIEIT